MRDDDLDSFRDECSERFRRCLNCLYLCFGCRIFALLNRIPA